LRRDTLAYDLPGCDSVVIREMLGVGVDTTVINLMTCDARQASKEYETLISLFGCDSVVVRNYAFVKADTSYQSVYDCQISDTIQEYKIFTDSPCDSVAVTLRIPAGPSTSSELRFSCDSLEVRVDTIRSVNQWGCDSLHVVETRYSGFRLSLRDTAICGLQTEYQDTMVIATKDCDSLVVTRYLGLPLDSSRVVVPTCDPTQAGSFRQVYANRYGCDSVVWIQVVLQRSDTSTYSEIVCKQSDAGVDTLRISRSGACDSILIRTRLYRQPDSTLIRNISCDPLQAGTRMTVLRGQYCDSLIITITELRPSYRQEVMRSTCHRDSVRTDTIRALTKDGCDSTLVIQYALQELDFGISSQDVLCAGNADGWIRLDAEPGFAGPFWTEVNGVWSSGVDLIGLAGGSYRVRMRDAAGCLSRDTLVVIGEPAVLTVDAGPDREVNPNEPVVLSATGSRPVIRWEWTPADRFDCADCDRPIGKFSDSTEVVVKVVDENGCESEDRLWIWVRKNKKVYVPNSFSPNGDGVNDRFYVFGDEGLELKLLRIYDRWGAEVFRIENGKLNDPAWGWDGNFRGQALNPGVYVYYASWILDGEEYQLFGEINLIR
jgi:gliding motility-associated-like protein